MIIENTDEKIFNLKGRRMKITEQIKELEKALQRSLMHENECAFVHTRTIKICLDSLQTWEEVLKELENIKDRTASPTMYLAYSEVIGIINQHLAEIEEVR